MYMGSLSRGSESVVLVSRMCLSTSNKHLDDAEDAVSLKHFGVLFCFIMDIGKTVF